MKRLFKVEKSIHLGDITIEPGCTVSSTDENWIRLPDGKIVYYPFDAFVKENSESFVLNMADDIGDHHLEKGDIIYRTADGWIMLSDGKIVYYSFDSLRSKHEAIR